MCSEIHSPLTNGAASAGSLYKSLDYKLKYSRSLLSLSGNFQGFSSSFPPDNQLYLQFMMLPPTFT